MPDVSPERIAALAAAARVPLADDAPARIAARRHADGDALCRREHRDSARDRAVELSSVVQRKDAGR